jgi:hypothetical protein
MASRLGGGAAGWEVDGPEDDGFGAAVGSCEEAWMSAAAAEARPCTVSRTCLLAPVSAGVLLPSELCRCSRRDEEAEWKDLFVAREEVENDRAVMDSAEALNIGNLNVAAHENRDQV